MTKLNFTSGFGLNDALEKLDETSKQMKELTQGIEKIVTLLEEQNKMLAEFIPNCPK